MKKIFKDALILFLITLVAGVLLGFVFEVTKEPRAKQEELKRTNAYKSVFADYFKDKPQYSNISIDNVVFEDYDISTLKDLDETLKYSGYAGRVTVDGSVIALFDNAIVGFAVTVTSKEGYGGDIQFTVGFASDGTVTGISFLSISETPGLGMLANDKSFIDKYVGRSGGDFIVSKDNSEGLANEIDAISGATITSRAVTSGVNVAFITVTAMVSNGGGIYE